MMHHIPTTLTPLKCRAVLFDLDGVLADSTASVTAHWTAWFTRHGLNAEQLMPVVHGRRAIDTIRAVAPHLDADAEHDRLVAGEADDVRGVSEMAGAREFVAQLPRSQWAVVTSGVRRVALARLGAAGVPAPDVLVPADEITHGKPDPEGYLTAARKLRVAPADCVVIEDAPAGIAAARAAGMRVLGLTTTHAASELADADLIAADLRSVRIEISDDSEMTLTVSPP